MISKALAHLEDRERQLDELRAKLQSGRDAIARGAFAEYTPALHQQIREAALHRARDRQRPTVDDAV